MPPRPAKGGRGRPSQAKPFTEEEEEHNRNLQLLLDDIDKSAEVFLKDSDGAAEALCKSITNMFSMSLMKIPAAIKELTFEEYAKKCEMEGSVPLALSNAMDSIVSNVSEVDQQLSSVRSAVKASTRKQKVSAASRSTAKKSRRVSSQEPLVEMTPAQSRQPPPMLGATPFITPKFNTRTPMSRTMSRSARPNEMLVSLSGSPVVPLSLRSKAAKAEAENIVPIPLGSGQTLNFPMAVMDEREAIGEGLDLDEDQLQRLSILQQNLTNMLKMRALQP